MARLVLFAPLALGLGFFAACSSSSSDGGSGASNSDGGTTPSRCAAPTGVGTTHASVTADETWSAADSPHVIANAFDVPVGVTVTLDPCATVEIADSVGILVEGSLFAKGDAAHPVTITRHDDGKAWSTIEVRQGGHLDLASTLVEGGGNPNGSDLSTVAAIDVRGDQTASPQEVFRAKDVTVTSSASVGVLLREGGGFTSDSANLTIDLGASYPVSSWANAAGSIPAGGDFAGNAIDKIKLVGDGARDGILVDTTFKKLDVPYFVAGSELTVGKQGSSPLLTIETGTTIQFAKLSRLVVDGNDDAAFGALAADGVVFTSGEDTPAAGDWVGILAHGSADPRTKIANSRIAYAGAESQISSYGCPSVTTDGSNIGALVIYSSAAPSSAWITGTTIESSARDGIVRGWTGDAVDFAASNTFTNVANCKQTLPKTSSACGEPGACK